MPQSPFKLQGWPDVTLMASGSRSRVDTGNQTQHSISGNDGTAAVAEQGQRQTDNRNDTDAHTHVDDSLEDQRRGGTEADQFAHIIRALGAYPNAADDDQKQQTDDQDTADEAQFLADRGKNIVRMLSEKVAALSTIAVKQTLSGQAAAGKGLQTLGRMPAFIQTLWVDDLRDKDI